MLDRHRRDNDNQNAVAKALKNGLGALLSRLMIIVGFPVMSALAAYAADLTLQKFEDKITNVANEVHRLNATIDEVSLDARSTSIAVTGLRIDVTRLQDQQQSLSDKISTKPYRNQ